jgi:uncharacterized coiled-coil protein SlyX
MKTLQEQQTESILSMIEAIKTLEQQLADAKKRVAELEAIVVSQREVIKELQ